MHPRIRVGKLPQGDDPPRPAPAVGEVAVDEPDLRHREHSAHALHARVIVILRRFEDEPHAVDPQDLGHIAAKVAQETLELHRIEHPQDRAMDDIGAGKVLIGGGDDTAMGVLKPVEPRLEPIHGDAAQIDDIAAHRPLIRRDQRPHKLLVVKNHIGLRHDLFAQGFVHAGGAAHICLGLHCRICLVLSPLGPNF